MKKTPGFWIGGLLIFMLVSSGCDEQQKKEVASKTKSQKTALVGIWQIIEFQSMDDSIGVMKPADPSKYILQFKVDSTVSMQLNCNRATARWVANPGQDSTGGRLDFSEIAMTRALCPPPSMDEKIAQDLSYIRSFLLKNEKLYLSLMADAGIYALKRVYTEDAQVLYRSPEDGGPQNWIVPDSRDSIALRSAPSINADIIIRYQAGTLLDNLGCRNESGQIWCDVQQLGGGLRGYVLAQNLLPATAPGGSIPTGPDDSSLRLGQGDIDATGTIPCSLQRGQPTFHCEFEVTRAGGGYATLRIRGTNDFERVIFFRLGIPIGVSSSEAEKVGEFSATKENDLHIIRVGKEHYEVPDAVIFGG